MFAFSYMPISFYFLNVILSLGVNIFSTAQYHNLLKVWFAEILNDNVDKDALIIGVICAKFVWTLVFSFYTQFGHMRNYIQIIRDLSYISGESFNREIWEINDVLIHEACSDLTCKFSKKNIRYPLLFYRIHQKCSWNF